MKFIRKWLLKRKLEKLIDKELSLLTFYGRMPWNPILGRRIEKELKLVSNEIKAMMI